MTSFLSWRRDQRHTSPMASLCCCLAAACIFVPLSASAQQCRGNPNFGCTNAGAKCSTGDVPNGRCTPTPHLPPGERECLCVGSPPPPVTMKLKYIVAGIVYAPPGCTSSTPNSACSQPGAVDYSSQSSLGTKITTADSFKNGVKVTVSFGGDVSGGSGSFAWSRTTGDTQSANLTKSGSLEIKVPGNEDGIDHDQDMFILLLNPTVTLTSDGTRNIYWQPGYSGQAVARYEVYVSELRNPAIMRSSVAAVLKALGFTAADYKTIRCLDQFAGPGIGPGGVTPDYCKVVATTGGPPPGLDLNRFRPTTWILPYEPPLHARSTQDEYTVSAEMHAGVKDTFGLKIEGEMTWTNSETDSNSEGSTQSASLTLVCPSIGYTGPTLFQVYWDVLYGTFLFVPFDPTSMEIIQHGTVTDARSKPVAAAPINLEYDGRTYHTFTTAGGTYRFIGLKSLLNASLHSGIINVRDKQVDVQIGSQSASAIQLQ
jgi:hypothetical protein